MELSQNEEDILEKIVGYGGYVTKEILVLYKRELTTDRCYRILAKLQDKKYIKEIPYFESFREPTVYQVTKKACRYFSRPEAYMRKKHKPHLIRRYLMKSHFLFLLAGQGKCIRLFSSVSRKQFLNEKGFTDYYLPKKMNKGTASIQIEEYILDMEPYSKSHTICFLYIDNPSYSIKNQLANLFKRYEKMQRVRRGFLDFLVVTENTVRAENFMKIYEECFMKKISMIDVKSVSINRSYKAIM